MLEEVHKVGENGGGALRGDVEVRGGGRKETRGDNSYEVDLFESVRVGGEEGRGGGGWGEGSGIGSVISLGEVGGSMGEKKNYY